MKLFIKRLSIILSVFLMCFSLVMVTNVFAVEEIQDNTDLSLIKPYQFTLTRDNMEIISQSPSVVRDEVAANGSWKDSTVFSLAVDKTKKENQSFASPISLKFTNAGNVYGKAVDVYITIENVDLIYVQLGNFDNPDKTVVLF